MTESKALPDQLPLFPLGGAILLPGEFLPLNVFEPRYLNMLDDVRQGSGHIGIIQTRQGGTPDKPTLSRIGGAGRLVHFDETPDGRYLITLKGVSRFVLTEELETPTPYRVARPDYTPFSQDLEPRSEIEGDRGRLVQMLQAWFQVEHVAADWESVGAAPLVTLVDQLSMIAPFAAAEKQKLLEAENSAERLVTMETILAEHLAGGADGPVQ
ncbi:LON peptidase substrate-binding domain-containing protein [Maricaulis parjimensis]|uniref:LON peptidase substrate-binding domain-containing protein n=1 Tax=Maricaulis parjimensis TaxID=144023 RepID=UPI0023AFE735|nr:LON peptidase substrate-binding domain-containing protein [Maricaulis parjimensis]